MNKPSIMPVCCAETTVWVDNIPGKEYIYCRECKLEWKGLAPSEQESFPDLVEAVSGYWSGGLTSQLSPVPSYSPGRHLFDPHTANPDQCSYCNISRSSLGVGGSYYPYKQPVYVNVPYIPTPPAVTPVNAPAPTPLNKPPVNHAYKSTCFCLDCVGLEGIQDHLDAARRVGSIERPEEVRDTFLRMWREKDTDSQMSFEDLLCALTLIHTALALKDNKFCRTVKVSSKWFAKSMKCVRSEGKKYPHLKGIFFGEDVLLRDDEITFHYENIPPATTTAIKPPVQDRLHAFVTSYFKRNGGLPRVITASAAVYYGYLDQLIATQRFPRGNPPYFLGIPVSLCSDEVARDTGVDVV